MVRHQGDRPVVTRQRCVEVPEIEQGVAAIAERVGKIGLDRDRGIVTAHGIHQPPEIAEHIAPIVVGAGMVGA